MAVVETQANGRETQANGRPSSKVAMSAVGWSPAEHLEMHEWLAYGRRIGTMGRSSAWWIGDWLRYGNLRFGERYVRAARVTGYDPQTLMNMVYVASAFEISRRREKLSWSHHAELAALDEEAQDEWLDRAERDRLSVQCLRQELRRVKSTESGTPGGASDAHSSDGDFGYVCPKCGFAFAVEDAAA